MTASRRQQMLLGTMAGYVFIVVTTVVNLVSVPISVQYFGAVKYGAFAVINSLLAYLANTYFGIPTATGVLAAQALDAFERLRIIIKSFLLISGIAALALMGFWLWTTNPNWIAVLGRVPPEISGEVALAAFAAAVLFLLNLPLSIFLAGFTAARKVHIERAYSMASFLMSFIALLVTVYLKGGLVLYTCLRGTLVLATSIAAVIHFLIYYGENRTHLKERRTELLAQPPDRNFALPSILRTSLKFFAAGLLATLIWNTDNLIISHFLGLATVTPYAVTFRVITITFVVFSVVNTALSPFMSQAFAAKDFQWLEMNYHRMLVFQSLLGGLIWIGTTCFAKELILWWVGPVGYGGLLVVFSLGGYGYLCSMNSAPVNLGVSLNFISIPIAFAEAALNIILAVSLIGGHGIGGIALAKFLATLLTTFWMMPIYIYKKAQRRISINYWLPARHLGLVLVPLLLISLSLHHFQMVLPLKIVFGLCVTLAYLVASYCLAKKEIVAMISIALKRPA